MPEYRFRCTDHGDFDEWRPMGEASSMSACSCGKLALRVYVMPHVSENALPVRTEGRRAEGAGAPPAGNNNSWERGIPTDARGMPFLGKGGSPIGIKEYSERRHEIDEHRRMLKQAPPVPTRKE